MDDWTEKLNKETPLPWFAQCFQPFPRTQAIYGWILWTP